MSAQGCSEDHAFKSLKVLVVHRYYAPDVAPCGTILQRIVQRWVRDGHRVDVLTGQPSYKVSANNVRCPKVEAVDGARVRRLRLHSEAGRPVVRVVNAIRLAFVLMWNALTGRYDVIMTSTVPPVVSALAAAIAARMTGARFIYHCQDIHPEVGKLSGEFSNPMVFKTLQVLDDFSCRYADPTVVLSRDMANTLRGRPDAKTKRVRVLNNFSAGTEKAPPDVLPFTVDSAKLTILFAGNIGRFQGLEIVMDAMGRLSDRDDIEFIFMGEGVAKGALQRRALEYNANVRFVGQQPPEVAKACMRKVDAGFLSLIPGLYRYVYPSKTITYLEQGCPLIVAAEPESELVKNIVAEGLGYSVRPEDGAGLAKLLIRLAADRSWVAARRAAALQTARADFSESAVLDKWSKMLGDSGDKLARSDSSDRSGYSI